MKSQGDRGAFSLVEVLVVIGIVGVLIALVVPAVQRVREAGNRTQCANNLRQIGLALHQYQGAHKAFPPGMSYQDGTDPYLYMSWNTRLLPFLEQEALWKEAVSAYALYPDPFWHSPPHPMGAVLSVFGCPTDGRALQVGQVGSSQVGFTSYLGVEGVNQYRLDGILFVDSRVRFEDVTDGTSNTLMVGERPPADNGYLSFGWWYAGWGQEKNGTADMVLGVEEYNTGSYAANCPPGPYSYGPGSVNKECDRFHFWSAHSGGANFLFVDGSVRFVAYSAATFMPALATRGGGEAVNLPD